MKALKDSRINKRFLYDVFLARCSLFVALLGMAATFVVVVIVPIRKTAKKYETKKNILLVQACTKAGSKKSLNNERESFHCCQ